jgi:hypothetical protein
MKKQQNFKAKSTEASTKSKGKIEKTPGGRGLVQPINPSTCYSTAWDSQQNYRGNPFGKK